jgi:hypothetical protein
MARSFEVDQQDIYKSAEEQINQTGKREDILEDQIKRRDTMLGSWGKPRNRPVGKKPRDSLCKQCKQSVYQSTTLVHVFNQPQKT